MNIEQLRAAGGFVADEPVKVPVTWKDKTFDVHIRRLAFGDVERMMRDEVNSSVDLIAASVLLGDDFTPISHEDAARLDVTLAGALLTAVNEVNAPKN
jgi:hypothetical protein